MGEDSPIAALGRAARLSPGDPIAWERLSEAYAAAGSLELSAVALAQAVHLQPEAARCRLRLAGLLWQVHRRREALAHCQEALRLDSGDAAHWRAVGVMLVELEEYESAAEHLREALQRDPKLRQTWSPLGWALYRAKRYAEAVLAFEEGTRCEPQDFWPWLGLGAACDSLGRAEDGAAAHAVAIRVDPTGVDALVELGRLRLGQSRPADALSPLERAARLRPGDQEIWAGITDAQFALGNLPAAIEAATERARVHIDPETALLSLVDLQCRADQYVETVRTVQRLMTTYPRTRRNATLVSLLGIALTGLKQYRAAVGVHRCALRIDDGLAASWHNLGFVCVQRRKWRRAAAFHAKAAAAKPDWPRAWRDLGRALRHCGRHDEAKAACHKALDLDERNPDSWRALGEVFAAAKDWRSVAEVLDHLRSIGPAHVAAFLKQYGADHA